MSLLGALVDLQNVGSRENRDKKFFEGFEQLLVVINNFLIKSDTEKTIINSWGLELAGKENINVLLIFRDIWNQMIVLIRVPSRILLFALDSQFNCLCIVFRCLIDLSSMFNTFFVSRLLMILKCFCD